jgi:hypothetical protein
MLNKYYEVFSKHLSVVKQFFFSGRGKKIKNQAVPRTDNGTKGNCNYISETFRQKKGEQQMQLFNVMIPTQ